MLRPARLVPAVLAAACAAAPAAFAADPKDVKVKGRPAAADGAADGGGVRDADAAPAQKGVPTAWLANTDMFSVHRRPDKARSAFWIPLVCFALPGFDQWWEGQWAPAAAYTGVAAAGYGYVDYTKHHNGLYEKARLERIAIKNGDNDPTTKKSDELDSKDTVERKISLAGQIAQWSGGMSTYHAFRTAVRTRKQYGEYSFLTAEETPFDIMAAPFHFQFLARPTTFIPLAAITALSVATLNQPVKTTDDVVKDKVTGQDYYYAGHFSYNAGTHEEAVFRGWLEPWLMQQWDSPFWSNATQALAFGAAHLGTVDVPVIQLLLGYHLGWVNQRNGYQISEGVFIHAWWDVVAFVSAYHYKPKPTAATNARLASPMLMLPPLELTF